MKTQRLPKMVMSNKKPHKKQSRKIATITICSSGSFYSKVLDIEKELKKLGFKVKIPKTANIMKRTKNFDIDSYKTWLKNKEDYHRKTKFMEEHFKKIKESDVILVVNLEKNGIKGYIGGNGLMEMTIAYVHKKPIFIYDTIPDDLNIKEEIYGLNPTFINKDLRNLLIKS